MLQRGSASTEREIKGSIWQYAVALGIVALTTAGLFSLRPYFGDANISLVYLLIVLFYATAARLGVALFCSILSFLCYDYFLIPPIFTFIPESPVKLLDPLSFLVVAVVTGLLAERSRQHAAQLTIYRQASQFRTTLLHLISHNLRTPVATIKTALTNLLATKDIEASHLDLLSTANRECDRLTRLITNVLQLSRLDANSVELHQDWNALDEVISAMFSRWSEAVSNQSLTAHIPQSLPLILFDFALISEVLTNLVDNAFRHGCAPVQVGIELHEQEIWISVLDAGPGAPVAERDKLFQPFSPAKSGNLGLGLAVCKGLVEAHHGRLWAEFNPGKTRFTFSLPLVMYQGDTHDSDDDR
jgi:two-component system sensor histidine kinase KdpD